MYRSRLLIVVLALVLALSSQMSGSARAGGGTQTIVKLAAAGTTTLSVQGARASSASGDLSLETRDEPEVDQHIPGMGTNVARVPSSHVPAPSGNAVAAGSSAFGFNGLSHLDQRLAGTGIYNGTQFSLEPPDQALCVGNGFVLESVNTALAVYNPSGQMLQGPVALNQFFGLAPEIIRSNPPVYGDFTSDPKCYYDPDTNRWFLTLLQIDVQPSTGDFLPHSSVLIAVSQSGNPTGGWNRFKLDTTNDGTNGTPNHAGCPCLGDQPLIGADQYGFYISTNEFPLFTAGFNGAQVYAMSKTALAAGTLPPVAMFGSMPLAEGPSYSLQPATVPPGGSYETRAGGTEYFLSALDFNATLDNRIAVWALSNTSSLNSGTPNVKLQNVVIDSEVYGQPPDAQQRPGPLPLAAALTKNMGKDQKLSFIAGNDDRMNQVVFAGGKLWSGVNTVVKTPNGPTRVGIAYFIVSPSISNNGVLTAQMAKQGYVAVNQNNVMYPSIGVNAQGKGAMVFTLVGPDYYPSAAYVLIDAANGAGDVHIAGAGTEPEDGFTGYQDGRTSRWGDYSAAVADATGNIWMATEYIPGGPRTSLANWGTHVSRVTP
jgi:hypothetical protein